ncbi:MAG TPA: hypothetical protein VIK28_07365, partial [Sedimentisphaerales bacterium]
DHLLSKGYLDGIRRKADIWVPSGTSQAFSLCWFDCYLIFKPRVTHGAFLLRSYLSPTPTLFFEK